MQHNAAPSDFCRSVLSLVVTFVTMPRLRSDFRHYTPAVTIGTAIGVVTFVPMP